jgi:hypothetical protein
MNIPALILLCCLSAALAQEPKAIPKRHSAKPVLSESFAKAGLRALIAIEDAEGEGDPISGEAKKAYQEAEAEYDPDKPAEAKMFSNLTIYSLLRSMNNLTKGANGSMSDEVQEKAKEEMHVQEVKCSSALETAFRHRVAIELPASCNRKK